jgi:hypothetical protein
MRAAPDQTAALLSPSPTRLHGKPISRPCDVDPRQLSADCDKRTESYACAGTAKGRITLSGMMASGANLVRRREILRRHMVGHGVAGAAAGCAVGASRSKRRDVTSTGTGNPLMNSGSYSGWKPASPQLRREGRRRSRPFYAWKEKLDVSRESSLQAYSAEASRTVNQPKFAGTSKLPPASAVSSAPALGCAASMTKANTP